MTLCITLKALDKFIQQLQVATGTRKAQEIKMNTATTTVTRNTYGEIVASSKLIAANALVAQAGNKIPATFDDTAWGTSGKERGHKIGDARHHEIYDINAECTRVLMCVRETEGTRYGVRTTSKEYFVIARHGRGIRVLPANKAVAAKAAKAAGDTLGSAIEVALGKAKLAIKPAVLRTGYKLLVRADSGDYASAWDQSAWIIGKARIKAASNDHTGGFYYYADLSECLAAAAKNDVFGPSHCHHRLAVVEVEASGRHYSHQSSIGTKLCASRVTVLREIASTL
jgi:hypothetical protein